MMDETMTLMQLKEYIREMTQDEILTVYLEETDDGRKDHDDGDDAV